MVTFQDLLVEHTKKAKALSKLMGKKRQAAIDALIDLEDALWRKGERAYDFAHRALFRGYAAKLAALIAEKRHREAAQIAAKLARGERLPWALQYSRSEATRVIKQLLRAYHADDKHSKRGYASTFLTVRSYAADLYQFMNFEIAAYECEHGDLERGLKALSTLRRAELKGVYKHRAFARVRDSESFLQILSTNGGLPKAVLAQQKGAPPTAIKAPKGAITEKELRAMIKRKRALFTLVYWPSGHLKSAATQRGTLRLDERPGSGSVSMHSPGVSLSESYRNGVARWTICTSWNDGDDGGSQRLAFSAWVSKWLNDLKR